MTTNPEFVSFREKFKLNDLGFAVAGGWCLSVRPGQLRLGAMLLSSGSGARSMEELTSVEQQGMGEAFALAEKLANRVFEADRVNYLCLMMQDPIVHFHVLPRYSNSVKRYGQVWEDPEWPAPPVVMPVISSDEVLAAVKEDLKRAFRA